MTAAPPATTRRRPLPPAGLAAAVLTGQAMAALDVSIVSVGGPSIQADLHLSGAQLQLAIYSYVLVYAVSLIIGARLGGRHGYGRLFIWGVAVFTASSLVCALAVTPAVLITARSVQGLGAALLVPQVLSLLQVSFEGDRRRRALSLYSTVLAVGVGAGQVLGGVLVGADLFGTGWRPVFLVNVPVGLAVLACSAGRLPSAPTGGRRRLDLAGACLLGVAVLAVVTPLTVGAGVGRPWWYWPSLLAGGILSACFGLYQARLAKAGREPLIDPALLAPREVRAGLAGIFVLMACFGALLLTAALFLQQALHGSAPRSGLTFAAFSAGFACGALSWARLPARWHPRLPLVAFTAMAAATAGLAWATGQPSWPWQATALMAVAGAANGGGFGALVQRTVGGVAVRYAADASGVLATTSQLALVAGIAAGGGLYLEVEPWAGAPLSWVLLAVAAAQLLLGAPAAAVLLGRRPPG